MLVFISLILYITFLNLNSLLYIIDYINVFKLKNENQKIDHAKYEIQRSIGGLYFDKEWSLKAINDLIYYLSIDLNDDKNNNKKCFSEIQYILGYIKRYEQSDSLFSSCCKSTKF